MERPQPFDRMRRRRARDRAFGLIAGRDQILAHVTEEMDARLELLGEIPEGPTLWIGALRTPPPGVIVADPGFRAAQAAGGVQCDEDFLPFADASFARIMSVMTLHGVNDLPGALILMRRALKSGGRLVAAFPAGQSLGAVRDSFITAETGVGRGVSPHLGPAVDPAEGAGLLRRAGFSDPVAEVETLTVRVADLVALARDVRAHGDSGWLSGRARGLTGKALWAAAEAAFAGQADPDRRVTLDLQILYLSGRCP